MNPTEFDSLCNLKSPVVNLYMLADKTPRTLLYGYSLVPKEDSYVIAYRHVYLGDDHKIHVVTYEEMSRKLVSYKAATEISAHDCLPGRFACKSESDFEFCKLLYSKGLAVPWLPDSETVVAKPLFHNALCVEA